MVQSRRGETIKPGDNLFEIETDKASMEVPSTTAGVLAEIRVPAGAVAPVGAVVAVIADGAGAAVASSKPAGGSRGCAFCASESDGGAGTRSADTPTAPAGPIELDPFFEVRTPARNYGPARLPGGRARDAARAAARGGRRHRPRKKFSPSGPHGPHLRARCGGRKHAWQRRQRRARPPASRRPMGSAPTRSRPSIAMLPFREVPLDGMRRTIARRLVEGQADHPAFLPDR